MVVTSTVPFRGGFEFLRTEATKIAATSYSIVERFDVATKIRACDLPLLVNPLLDTLLLQATEEEFGDGIVPAIASPTKEYFAIWSKEMRQ